MNVINCINVLMILSGHEGIADLIIWYVLFSLTVCYVGEGKE